MYEYNDIYLNIIINLRYYVNNYKFIFYKVILFDKSILIFDIISNYKKKNWIPTYFVNCMHWYNLLLGNG